MSTTGSQAPFEAALARVGAHDTSAPSEPVQGEQHCPLCASTTSGPQVVAADGRRFRCCRRCLLLFTDARFHLGANDAKARYLNHQNGPDQPGHTEFLSQLLQPLLGFLSPGMRGLDYGCGPVPTFSVLLGRAGFHCDDFDPHFFPQALQGSYDFIVSTEVFEHLERPAADLETISSLLVGGGFLAVMTERWQSLRRFSSWYYAKDPTHVVFYHRRTFDVICRLYGFRPTLIAPPRIAILQKL